MELYLYGQCRKSGLACFQGRGVRGDAPMNTPSLVAICTVASGMAGLLVSLASFLWKRRRSSAEDGKSKGIIASDIGYIKAGVDDLKREIRDMRSTVSELSERISRCEESCKQAHRRIDEWWDHPHDKTH